MNTKTFDVIKQRVRKLKKFEIKIRFDGEIPKNAQLIWDSFFDLRKMPNKDAKYNLHFLSNITRDEYKNIVNEFFAQVFFQFYKENEIANINQYDPGIRAELNLPGTADEIAIKKRFRQLAKEYHPDAGGSGEKFIELMEAYKKLIGN